MTTKAKDIDNAIYGYYIQNQPIFKAEYGAEMRRLSHSVQFSSHRTFNPVRFSPGA